MAGRTNKAFTLVELLAVISIITLLMAILLPALQRARAQAHKLFCRSTLRSIALAHKQYVAETGKTLPHTAKDPYTPWYNNDYFRRALGLRPATPEEKTRRLPELQEWKPNYPRKYVCPAATYALEHPEDGLYPIDRSYGVNTAGDARAKAKGIASLADKESWVRHPSRKLFMADALDWWILYPYRDRYLLYGEQWLGAETYGMIAYRHNRRVNVLYWDGHAGQLSVEDVNDWALWDPLK